MTMMIDWDDDKRRLTPLLYDSQSTGHLSLLYCELSVIHSKYCFFAQSDDDYPIITNFALINTTVK